MYETNIHIQKETSQCLRQTGNFILTFRCLQRLVSMTLVVLLSYW